MLFLQLVAGPVQRCIHLAIDLKIVEKLVAFSLHHDFTQLILNKKRIGLGLQYAKVDQHDFHIAMNEHVTGFVAMIKHYSVGLIGIANVCPVKLRQTYEIVKEPKKLSIRRYGKIK